jgi:hypothetical protein
MDVYPGGKTQKPSPKRYAKKSTLGKPGCFCPATDLDLLFLRADARGHGHGRGHALLPGRAPRATHFVHVRFAGQLMPFRPPPGIPALDPMI